MNRNLLFVILLVGTGVVWAEEPAEEKPAAVEEPQAEPAGDDAKQEGQKQEGPKLVSGMSVLGNQEAPKSLVIVPWKTSQLGDAAGISTMLDDSKQPVDREVFLRALSYYEIRSETKE